MLSQEADEVEEMCRSRRSLGISRRSLDSPEKGSERALQLDGAAAPADGAHTWRQLLPWNKPKKAKEEKPKKQVIAQTRHSKPQKAVQCPAAALSWL